MRGPYPVRERKRGPTESIPVKVLKWMKTFWWMGWILMGFCITFLPGRRDRVRTGKFQGSSWRKHGWTLAAAPIYETPWSIVELHTVQINGNILQNWLWMEEKPAINVLARQDGQFLMFKQEKYGLLKESLAPVGGMIEPKEQPLAAAKRELLEEMGLVSDNWTPLGTYRTAVNRGGGFSTFYIADDCRVSETKKASDDLETQEVVRMSLEEVRTALLAGEFGEVKWTANIGLALLHLDQQNNLAKGSDKQRNLQEVDDPTAFGVVEVESEPEVAESKEEQLESEPEQEGGESVDSEGEEEEGEEEEGEEGEGEEDSEYEVENTSEKKTPTISKGKASS